MKGVPILIAVKEPKEGMKVVAGPDKLLGTVVKMFQEKHRYYDFDAMWNVRTSEDTYVYFTKELQQIAIEYRGEPQKGTKAYDLGTLVKHVLLLHPDDYEKVLPLIGQEVEFTITEDKSNIVDRDSMSDNPVFGDCTKLIAPAPVVYTEEEAKHLAEEYASEMYDRIAGGSPPINIEDWWDKHKKK